MKSPADMPESTRLDPIWRRDPKLVRVYDALGAPRVDVRTVGGCVRDAIMGRDTADSEIDIGTPETPDEVAKRLQDAGLRAIPTGIDHGTITALVDGRTFEITSLRRDTACDGRHAAVAFTTDWREDAGRRDFTFNAMSMTPDGLLHDYHGGVTDARTGRVRFVGEPADRIQEDYLRILRLFRFAALYGRAPIDAATLAAAGAHKEGLARLSAERVQTEMAKLLGAPDPNGAIKQMRESGVLAAILPLRDDVQALRNLIDAERGIELEDRSWLRRLAVLIPAAAAGDVADRLKLSNADKGALAALVGSPTVTPRTPSVDIDAALYGHGTILMRERALLAWAAQPSLGTPLSQSAWLALIARIGLWTHRPLPLGGEDVLKAGVVPGPEVGRMLKGLTEWWILGGFAASRAEALAELARRAALNGVRP